MRSNRVPAFARDGKMCVEFGDGLRRRPQRRYRPDHQLEAQRLEFLGGAIRGTAEFRHVGEQGGVNRGGKGTEVFIGGQGLGKNHVSAGLPIEPGALNGVVEAHRRGVGAGNDLQMRPSAPCGGNLAGHVVRVGQALVVKMAAFFRQHLVLDLHCGGARLLQLANQAHDVERLAVSGIAVHQDRQAGGANQLASRVAQFFQGDDAEVRQRHRGAEGGAGQVQSLETGLLGKARRQRVVRPRHADDARPVQQRFQPVAGRAIQLRRGIEPRRTIGGTHGGEVIRLQAFESALSMTLSATRRPTGRPTSFISNSGA